ncbi:MAG: DUF3783 domain-containing protein [Syntrophobacteraceae bacterium]|jgi:hypothetical protein|nr:DUF3783 domain-containing protein [Syntrophobacteraceae bacterium]
MSISFRGGDMEELQSRLLVWNYTEAEKSRLDDILRQIGAPPAVTIEPGQGRMKVGDIVAGRSPDGDPLVCDEKVILFYEVPHKGVLFLMKFFKQIDLPRPIYAVVTEQSIQWPFHELLEHLIEERDRMEGKP